MVRAKTYIIEFYFFSNNLKLYYYFKICILKNKFL